MHAGKQGSFRAFTETGYYTSLSVAVSKSTKKQLESILTSLEEAREKGSHCRVPSKSSKVPLHSTVSPKSHSPQQLLSKISLLSLLESPHLSCHPFTTSGVYVKSLL